MPHSQTQTFWRPYFVLVLALALTASATFYLAQAAHEQDRLRFERMVDRTRDAMKARLRTYVAVLRGGVGLINASNLQRFGTQNKHHAPTSQYLIGRAAFRNYTDTLRLQADFPGIQGIGFTARVLPEEKAEFVAQVRREHSDFRMWPALKAEFGPDWHSIIYLEPMDERNQAAIGFNMYSEPRRRHAMQDARDSGQATASGRVLLKQEITTDKQAGFLIYVPVYRGTKVPDTVQERRAQLLGFVYSPFRSGDFLENLLDEPTQERLLFQLYDGIEVAAGGGHKLAPSGLLYQSADLPTGYEPQYTSDVTIKAAGRMWKLRMMSRPEFERDSSSFLAPFIAVSGMVVSLLLFGVSWTQAVAQQRAEQAAQELKQSEAEREKLLESEHEARLQAEAANRAKDEFLAVVSHELRTPLTSILGWASLLRNSPPDEKNYRTGLETIERNAYAQSQLIEDLLDMSRIISGHLRLTCEPVDLAPILDAALEISRPAAQAKNIQLRRQYDDNSARVMGDAHRLQQIVWNLLSNAIKFTPSEGIVELSLRRVIANADDKGHFEISVRDNGIGMEPEFVPQAFDRFRQADATSTRSQNGLGLGLSIVRHLVEMHGGEVRAESAGKNQGSTFTVRLPALETKLTIDQRLDETQAVSTTIEGENNLVTAQLQGKKILVVEDEPDARRMIATILQSYGAQVQSAALASAALELVSS